eukprot:scaffold44631_cov26-Tisochrysis_lutea.AAC.4
MVDSISIRLDSGTYDGGSRSVRSSVVGGGAGSLSLPVALSAPASTMCSSSGAPSACEPADSRLLRRMSDMRPGSLFVLTPSHCSFSSGYLLVPSAARLRLAGWQKERQGAAQARSLGSERAPEVGAAARAALPPRSPLGGVATAHWWRLHSERGRAVRTARHALAHRLSLDRPDSR